MSADGFFDRIARRIASSERYSRRAILRNAGKVSVATAAALGVAELIDDSALAAGPYYPAGNGVACRPAASTNPIYGPVVTRFNCGQGLYGDWVGGDAASGCYGTYGTWLYVPAYGCWVSRSVMNLSGSACPCG